MVRLHVSTALVLATVFSLAAGITACSSGNGSDSDSAGDKKVVYSVYDQLDPFWIATAQGVTTGSEGSGLTPQVLSANDDPGTQVSQVETSITNGVAGIIIAPVDPAAAAPAVLKANAAGTPVVTVDSAIEGGTTTTLVAADNYGGGKMLGEYVAKTVLPKGGKVAVLTLDQYPSVAARVKGFVDGIATNPAITIAKTLNSSSAQDKARSDTENLLAGFPDVNLIFSAVGSATALSSVAAIQAQGANVKVVSFDSVPASRAKMLEPQSPLVAEVAQFPYLMGTMAASTMADILAKKSVQKQVDVPVTLVTPNDLVTVDGAIRIKGHEQDDGPK